MTREPTRVGIAGLGVMGRHHLHKLATRPDVVIVAIADPNASALDAAAPLAPYAKAFHDGSDMIASRVCEAVIVAVPPLEQHRVAMAGIDRNMPMLLEKPIAATVQQAQEIVARSEETGTRLQMGLIERFNPAFTALEGILATGLIGAVVGLETTRVGPRPSRERGVGVAFDLATHDLDLICRVVGERPVSVAAVVNRGINSAREDLLYGLLEFPSGVIARLEASWLGDHRRRRMEVIGSEGAARADLLHKQAFVTRGGTESDEAFASGAMDHDALQLQHDAFLHTARGMAEPAITARDGLWALWLATCLLQSAAEHRAIRVEDPSGAVDAALAS